MKYFMIDNLVFGGAERQASYLINNNIGIDQIILIEDERKYELVTQKPIIALNPRILKLYQRPIEDMRASNKLAKLFTPTDIVISFLERSNIMNVKSALKSQHKTIISVRNYLSEKYKSAKYFWRVGQIRKYYPLADLIVVNSLGSKKDLITNFDIPEEKIKVIYNCIDLDKVELLKNQKIEEKYEHIFEFPVLINIGSLTPQKAQQQLIESFKLVKKEYPGYKLVIIGTGKLEKELMKTIEKLNLKGEVYLLGNVKNPFKFLNKSEIFVLNSNFEGFPNVLLEALAVGVPVISKNCLSGPAEMLEVPTYDNEDILLTKYGYLYPKKDNNQINYYEEEKMYLFESISNLIDMKENNKYDYECISANCIRRARDFSKQKIMRQWSELLK
ncbi:MAG TPA: glycosyltransferase [Clostridiales bacterium]|nr:glycosyltransferase [Clostridiales bacterium]